MTILKGKKFKLKLTQNYFQKQNKTKRLEIAMNDQYHQGSLDSTWQLKP